MFHYFSSKFKVQPYKQGAARVVMNKEFGIMNCFTLEASMASYIDKDRATHDFLIQDYYKMGSQLATALC
jgi:hypothetical protein